MSGQVFVISGPSGAGKSTLIEEVRKRVGDIAYSVSHTSRRPRQGEIDGAAYHFVDRDAFRRMIEQHEFAEWAEVFGDYYGTSYGELEEKTGRGLDVIMDLDVQGAGNLRKAVGQCVLVFVFPPSMEALEQRLRNRGTDNASALAGRMQRASLEIQQASRYDYLIVNDRLEQAVEEMTAVVLAERCRTGRKLSRVQSLFQVPLSD